MSRRDIEFETLAFRIWQFCDPKEWDVTVKEIADEMGVSYQQIDSVLRRKNWTGRTRSGRLDSYSKGY